MQYHIPSSPSPLFLTFFESLPRRVFFSDLWNPGGVWWYFKSKFWPLHTRTEMSDLSDKLTLKFHNLNCKKIFFPRKKRYTIFSPFWCPTKKFQKPILYITIFLADDEAQLSLGFRFHIKSQASLLQQQPKKRFQKSPEMTCFSVIKNPDGAFGFVVSHFISVFTTNCSVYFFFSFFYIMLFFIHFCFWLKLTVFQAQKAFVETRTCHPSQKLLFSHSEIPEYFFFCLVQRNILT